MNSNMGSKWQKQPAQYKTEHEHFRGCCFVLDLTATHLFVCTATDLTRFDKYSSALRTQTPEKTKKQKQKQQKQKTKTKTKNKQTNKQKQKTKNKKQTTNK